MANEKRLIDLDLAIERAKESDKIVKSSIWETCEVVEFLEDCPTVDAVEVVHSAWKHGNCMNCGLYVGETTSKHFHYCPNCGAKMDEERKNENESKSNA